MCKAEFFEGKNSHTNPGMWVKLKSYSKSGLHTAVFIAIGFEFWTILNHL